MEDKLNGKEKSIVILLAIIIAIIGIAFIAIVFLEKHSYSSAGNPVERKELTEEETDLKTAQDYAAMTIEDMSFSGSGKESSGQKEKSDGEQSDDDYIIPDSDSRKLEESDLKELSEDELFKARNEIYARHGRKFDDKDLQEYFNSKSWYEGIYDPADFPENALSDLERKNAAFILNYEKENGYE